MMRPASQPMEFPPLPRPLIPPEGFEQAAAEIGVEFEGGDIERLGRYLGLLLEVNTRFNLTAVKDPGEAWRRHVLDSLTLLGPLAALMEENEGSPRSGGLRVIDVGSGGGLPGIVLAITMREVSFTLLETTGKKAEFLRHAAKVLGLANVTVVSERAEKAGHMPEHREQYDAAVARAVGPMSVIAELTSPLVKVGGQVVLIKGERAEEELAQAKQALHLLHLHHAATIQTPTNRLVVLEKPRRSPRLYPRREGEPKRAPLGG